MQKQKYIRTVNGKTTINTLLSSNSSSSTYTTLPYEHLIQNLCSYITPHPNYPPNTDISLSNLSTIHKHPYSFYQNLYLEPHKDKITSVLTSLHSSHNTILICDVTNTQNGQNKELLHLISKNTSIHICTGISINLQHKGDLKQYSNDLQYEIIYGKDDNPNYIPSFISELQIDESFHNDTHQHDIFTMILTDILNVYSIPIYIKLTNTQKQLTTNTFLPWLCKQIITHKSKIIFELPISDDESTYSNITELSKYILKEGFSIVFGLYECDIQTKSNNANADVYYAEHKCKFINGLLCKELRCYIHNIMISNNVNFKIHLKEYGGFGYENVFEHYLDKVICGLNENEIKKIKYENILTLLEYWYELDKIQKSKRYVTCVNCGVKKEENDKELFSKNDKIFCSFKCLKSYLNKV